LTTPSFLVVSIASSRTTTARSLKSLTFCISCKKS
jgi:hypothetical protein